MAASLAYKVCLGMPAVRVAIEILADPPSNSARGASSQPSALDAAGSLRPTTTSFFVAARDRFCGRIPVHSCVLPMWASGASLMAGGMYGDTPPMS